jgi:hypothetical protein
METKIIFIILYFLANLFVTIHYSICKLDVRSLNNSSMKFLTLIVIFLLLCFGFIFLLFDLIIPILNDITLWIKIKILRVGKQ